MERAMTIREVRRRYWGEWVALRLSGAGNRGVVIAHDCNREKLHRKALRGSLDRLYITFAGPLVRPGYSIIF